MAAAVVTFVQVTSLLRKIARNAQESIQVLSYQRTLLITLKKENIYCLVTLISHQFLCHLHEKWHHVLLPDTGFNTTIPQT